MAELKTKQTKADVDKFLKSVKDTKQRNDSYAVIKLMKKITKKNPKMWGPSIIGFGDYHYKYKSGREGDWFLTGFSPRKQSLTLYLMCDIKKFDHLLKKLGKHKTGKGCLYINSLEDVDTKVLEKLINESIKYTSGINKS